MPKILANNSQAVTFDSEEELEYALNNAALPTRWKVAGKGGKFTLIGMDSGIVISPETQEVLANMPVSLTGAEEMAVIQFVNSQSVSLGSGNWSKIDAFAHGKLSNATNKLWKWKANSAMINNGAVLSADGWVFNGIDQYIDSAFDPAVSGVNYTQNDAIGGAYVVTPLNPLSFDTVIGARIAQGGAHSLYIAANNNASAFITQINASAGSTYLSAAILAETLYVIARTSAVLSRTIFINGASFLLNTDRPAVAIPSLSIYLGAVNTAGSPSLFGAQTLSSIIIGGAVGFNHADFYTNLVALNAAL